MSVQPITCLFVDIGGVLLNDGWVAEYRRHAAEQFHLDLPELETRHRQAYDTHEVGKITLDDYLDAVIFTQDRSFSRSEFRDFMFAQSKPCLPTIDLIRSLKQQHRLKVAVVSNEGRELNAHRIRKFKLAEFVDLFVSSCFVHIRKPDPDILRVALDVANVAPGEVLYIDNTRMFVQVAELMGFRSILHEDYVSTLDKFAAYGLSIKPEARVAE